MMETSRPVASTRFQRYVVVGFGTNATLYTFFLSLVWIGLPPVGVSASCYILGVTLSYLLNRRWSFESQSSHRHDLPRFLIAYGIGFVVTIISMYLLVDPIGPAFAQLLTIGICAVTIFSTLSLLQFGAAK